MEDTFEAKQAASLAIMRRENELARQRLAMRPKGWCIHCVRVHISNVDREQSHRGIDGLGNPLNEDW